MRKKVSDDLVKQEFCKENSALTFSVDGKREA
jgi:hypothetical protein